MKRDNFAKAIKVAVLATVVVGAVIPAAADVDSLGKTPTYWYTFDGVVR